MSFSQKLAGKYVLSQKRHSVFTILSIVIAVVFITVVYLLFSSYMATMKNAYTQANPWHAEIRDVTDEEIELLKADEFIEETEEKTRVIDGQSVKYVNVKFAKDIEDPGTLIRKYFNDAEAGKKYTLNHNLIEYELIGVNAKAGFIMVFAFLVVFVLIFIACARFMIDTAFEVSSKEREVQFGVLASLGASKSQIVRIILWEGIYLSAVAIPLGIGLGIGVSYGIFRTIANTDILQSIAGVEQSVARFSVGPLYIVFIVIMALVWVMLSAYGTGMRFAKKPPIEIIRHGSAEIKKVTPSRIWGKLAGITGIMASRNVVRNTKRFLVTVVSITLSFALSAIFSTVVDNMNKTAKAFELTEDDYIMYFKYSPEVFSNGEDYPSIADVDKGYALLKNTGCFEIVQNNASRFFDVSIEDLSFRPEVIEYIKTTPSSDKVSFRAYYYSEEFYNFIFDNNPPVPYSELIGNHYVLCVQDKQSVYLPNESPINLDSDTSFNGVSTYPISEYEIASYDGEVSPEPVAGVTDDYGNPLYKVECQDISGNIVALGTSDMARSYEGRCILIGAEEDFRELISTTKNAKLHADTSYMLYLNEEMRNNLPDADAAVTKFIESTPGFENNHNMLSHIVDDQRYNKVFRITSVAIVVFVLLIALINEVNIISTGILNRRREIASLRSLGMSGGQLTSMMLIECGLYSVVSAVVTMILSQIVVLFYNWKFFAEAGEENMVSYGMPIVSILVMLVIVFAAGAVTTFVSISDFRQKPISEEMRTVE